MTAEVAAEKTYYALVSPTMEGWKTRFLLKQIPGKKLTNSRFNGWKSSCKWVGGITVSTGFEDSDLATI